MHYCMNVNICNFAIFGPIFMKFSPNCRAKKLGMLFNILGRFCSFFGLGRGRYKIGIGKSLVQSAKMG